MKPGIVQKLQGFWVFMFLAAAAPGLAANVLEGRVLDVFNGKVTLQLKAEELFQQGDRVDLSYMAGPMEMLIGQYEVIQTQGPVVFAKEISLSMPPIKDMAVRVVRVASTPAIVIPDNAAMDPAERDPRFLEANTRIKADAAAPLYEEKKGPAGEAPVVEVLGPNEGLSAPSTPSGAQTYSSPAPAADTADALAFDAFFKDRQQDSSPAPLELLGEKPLFNPGEVKPLPAPGKYMLGVEIMNNDRIEGQVYAAAPIGIRVVGVTPRSAAQQSGIRPKDVISAINNIPVKDTAQFISVLNTSGGKIFLEIQRNGKIIKKNVTLQERTR